VRPEQNNQRKNYLNLPPDERAKLVNHRAYIGGNDCETWYGIGKLQYHFLVKHGLRNDHLFLDIACGALRLGQYLIPYLDSGNYHGLEGEESLVRRGLEHEFFCDVVIGKQPKFSFNYDFDFTFVENFDYAIAQSLFTHLTLEDIEKCFKNLSCVAMGDSKFFFTFFEGSDENNPASASHAQLGWQYSFSQLEQQASPYGWKLSYIGDWSHPRNQMMVLAERVN
jgi:hypothetical protein